MPDDRLPPALAEVAHLYEAMAARGFGQTAVDDMELWVIAEILGLHHETEERALTPEQHAKESRELAAARGRAAQLGLPPPKATPSGPVATPAMVEALRRRRKVA